MIDAIRAKVPSWFEQAAVFALVGGLGFALDASVLTFATWQGATPLVGRAISIVVTVIFTWQLNRRLTFKLKTAATFHEFGHYVSISLASICINYAVFTALIFLKIPLVLAAGVGTVVAATFNFIRYRALMSKSGERLPAD